MVARLAHRSFPEAEKTNFRGSCRARCRESQIARKPASSPRFPAKAITSPTPISQKYHTLPGSSQTTKDCRGNGNMRPAEPEATSRTSNKTQQALSANNQWIEGNVFADSLISLHLAEFETLVRGHAGKSGVPTDGIPKSKPRSSLRRRRMTVSQAPSHGERRVQQDGGPFSETGSEPPNGAQDLSVARDRRTLGRKPEYPKDQAASRQMEGALTEDDGVHIDLPSQNLQATDRRRESIHTFGFGQDAVGRESPIQEIAAHGIGLCGGSLPSPPVTNRRTVGRLSADRRAASNRCRRTALGLPSGPTAAPKTTI